MKASELAIKLSTYQGQYVSFASSPRNQALAGYWSRRNGTEGGELLVDLISAEVLDFDGDYDLPDHVRRELADLNVQVSF